MRVRVYTTSHESDIRGGICLGSLDGGLLYFCKPRWIRTEFVWEYINVDDRVSHFYTPLKRFVMKRDERESYTHEYELSEKQFAALCAEFLT